VGNSAAVPPQDSLSPAVLVTAEPWEAQWIWFSLLFLGSGCAALIYELVWFQNLQLVIGSTAISLGVLLASFMGGMCLGSVLVPRWLPSNRHPLRLWAVLELGVGILGAIIFFAMPVLGKAYAAVVPGGAFGLILRGLLSSICLLPPTMLMGATLPVMARLAPATPRGASLVGLLYGANTVGAVLGALLAGFILLRLFNSAAATAVAVGLNVTLAVLGLTLPAPASAPETTDETSHAKPIPTVPHHGWLLHPQGAVYVAIGISGFCALGAEVLWTRLLSLMFGGTTYTFSVILAVFLMGLGIGSAAGAIMARRTRNAAFLLGLSQWLLAGAVAWAAFMLTSSMPYWPINPLLSKSVWFNFQLDLLRCAWAVFPATCLWGASFPLALAAIGSKADRSGDLVSKLYAANTLGAILGAVLVTVLLIAWLGTQQTQRLLILLSGLSGFIAWSATWERRRLAGEFDFATERIAPARRRRSQVLWLVLGLVTIWFAWSVPPVPWPVIAYGRYLPQKTELGTALYVGEGMNASVVVTELASGVRNFHVSGKIEASTDQQDMRLQRMLAHLPALFHPDPRSVLVVGCGAGVTAGSFLVYPGIKRIRLCEIEPLIPKKVARFFGEENYDVVEDPRVHLAYDDARHFILTTRETFDVITSDPIHPWVKGAATLYTKEYFELCKRHLKPGGFVSQWVPLYESDSATVKSEIATFFSVFPYGTIWSNEDLGAGYDLVMLGQTEPLEIDLETLQRRLNRADHSSVAKSLRDVGIRSALTLVATYATQARDLQGWLKHAQLNRDSDLRLQYLAGVGLNANESDSIYAQLSSYRHFPQEIFIGSNTWSDALKRTFEQPDSTRNHR
jgi:spermidine synthase